MNIVVRNMIRADIENLSRAFAGQGWGIPSAVLEQAYGRMLRRTCDVLVAEYRGKTAGFARLEWIDAGESTGHALIPEVREFLVLTGFSATGVADALNAELERRVATSTGEITATNALMAVYGTPPPHPYPRCRYVLDGLLIGSNGNMARVRNRQSQSGVVIRMARGH